MQLPRARRRPDPGRRRTSRDSDVDEEDDDDNRDHQLASLFSLTGKPHAQRKCVVCKPTQRKASYYCKSCGPCFVLCGPTVHSVFFFPKLCLILKNRFLARLSSNFQERLLTKYFMPQFIFGVSIFSLRA